MDHEEEGREEWSRRGRRYDRRSGLVPRRGTKRNRPPTWDASGSDSNCSDLQERYEGRYQGTSGPQSDALPEGTGISCAQSSRTRVEEMAHDDDQAMVSGLETDDDGRFHRVSPWKRRRRNLQSAAVSKKCQPISDKFWHLLELDVVDSENENYRSKPCRRKTSRKIEETEDERELYGPETRRKRPIDGSGQEGSGLKKLPSKGKRDHDAWKGKYERGTHELGDEDSELEADGAYYHSERTRQRSENNRRDVFCSRQLKPRIALERTVDVKNAPRLPDDSQDCFASNELAMPEILERILPDTTDISRRARNAWHNHLRRLERRKPDIFSSPEARLELRSKATRGRSVYEGIGITTRNCLGLNMVISVHFKGCSNQDALSRRDLDDLTTVVSQFLRWCVVSSSCRKTDVWMAKTLFDNIAKISLVRRFVAHFQVRCKRRTVKQKATGLQLVCQVASGLCGTDRNRGNELKTVSCFLHDVEYGGQEVPGSGVGLQAQQCAPGNEPQLTANYLMEKFRECRLALDECMESYRSMKMKHGREEAKLCLKENQRLEKWSIHFLAFLVFTSGFQAPKFYADLKIPATEMLLHLLSTSKNGSFVSVNSLCDGHSFVFHSSIILYLAFHARVVLPIIHESTRRGMDQDSKGVDALLVQIKNGRRFECAHVTRSILKFFSCQTWHSSARSRTQLQAMYAVTMIDIFHRKLAFVRVPKAHFLHQIARQTGSSSQELQDILERYDDFGSFGEHVSRLIAFWDVSSDEE